MYNIFISYRRDGGYEMARLLYEHLKNLGYKPFFDLEELRTGQFNVHLYKTIDECPVFLVVLNPGCLERTMSKTDWLRLEIEHALSGAGKRRIIPVMTNGFEWGELPDSLAGLPLYNGVRISHDYFDASIAKIIEMMKDANVLTSTGTNEPIREQNTYFTAADQKEKRRLEIQQHLMEQFDKEAYQKAASRYKALRILDIGSNNGDFIMNRLGSAGRIEKLIGLEYDRETVDAANKKYGKPKDVEFIWANVEENECFELLKEKMAECGIKSFNVVNLSMIVLHLKNPYRLLKNIRPFLERGATVIVKDIDDGFNVAYPDPNGDFERVFGICARNETSGYRASGRQIYSLLKGAGFREIELEKLCLTTVGMDYEEKSAFFDVYFSFILEDLKIMAERYPDDSAFRRDLRWYAEVYDSLEERFHSDDFFFSLGFLLYTARK